MFQHTSLLRALTLVALASSLAGCGSGGGSSITGRYGSLTFAAITDKASYNPGETVNFTFTATNTGSSAVTISGSGLDFPGNGVPIAARVEKNGQVVTLIQNNNAVGGSVTIAPGGSATSSAAWDQKDSNGSQASPGTYTLTVLLAANNINGTAFTTLTDALAAPPVTIVIH
jgi:hypothetical protein